MADIAVVLPNEHQDTFTSDPPLSDALTAAPSLTMVMLMTDTLSDSFGKKDRLGTDDDGLPCRQSSKRTSTWKALTYAAVSSVALLALLHQYVAHPITAWNLAHAHSTPRIAFSQDPACPAQPAPLAPSLPFTIDLTSYRNYSAGLLSTAVQHPTVSYDDNGPVSPRGADPRWEPFYDFHEWMGEVFKDVLQRDDVTVTKVNTLGFLTEIQGTDPALKPLMLMSHLDVTPVENKTLNRWTHPPFSGHNDGSAIWGRGSSDCKTLLVAQYEALSLLFKAGFIARRTIILAHGFDEEELHARQGAGHLAMHLENKYGQDSMLMIVDEGSSAAETFGTAFALPASGEKGYLDARITIGTPGGHSSVPPAHTAIGVAAQVVNALEENPFELGFDGPTDPIAQYVACLKEYGKHIPKEWSKAFGSKQHCKSKHGKHGEHGKHGKHRKNKDPGSSEGIDWTKVTQLFAATSPASKAVIGTTQAIDIIHGGIKINALPEEVTILVNHRISFTSNVSATRRHIANVVKPIAKKFNLRLTAFNLDTEGNTTSIGYVKLEDYGIPLEPAPRSPTSGGVWDMFSATIRHVHRQPRIADAINELGEPYIVSPFASTGNTDTKVMHGLTKHIYRYMGNPIATSSDLGNAHTVNEKTSIDSHLKIVEWIYTLVQNANAYNGEQ